MRIGKFKLKHYINYIAVALVLIYYVTISATGGHIAFINLSGGIGIPYRPAGGAMGGARQPDLFENDGE